MQNYTGPPLAFIFTAKFTAALLFSLVNHIMAVVPIASKPKAMAKKSANLVIEK